MYVNRKWCGCRSTRRYPICEEQSYEFRYIIVIDIYSTTNYLNAIYNYFSKRLKWFVKQRQVHKTK